MVSPRPLSKKAKKILYVFSKIYLSPFSEGDWGNRSLGSKERFPQKFMFYAANWLLYSLA